jgi:transglutaminase-like putative cysteine protease
MGANPVSPQPSPLRREASRTALLGELTNLVLLILVVLPPTWALRAVPLDPDLPFGMLTWIALAAIAVGVVFAMTDAPGDILHAIAMVGGTMGVFFVVARIIPALPPSATLRERLAELIYEIAAWVAIILSGSQATNNLLFLLLLALIAWLIGYFGAWAVFRERSAWWPVTVSATALTLILATFPDLSGFMVIQLLASLLLVGRVNLQSRQHLWGSRGLRQASNVAGRAFRASLALAVALVLLTWVAPAALASRAITQRLGRADQPWQTAQQEFNRLFGGLQAPNQDALSGFSRSLTFHGSFHLADTPVLQIQASQQEYWRVMVFDRYTGHGWLSSDPIDQRTLPAGSDVLRPPDVQRSNLVQQVNVLEPRGNFLVGASQPTIFDQTVRAQAFPDGPGGSVDLVSAQTVQPLAQGNHYTVVSGVSTASVSELRAASRSYPAEIQQRYLPLPAIPPRVVQLAQQLTANAPDAYDKAVAVESYLRAMPYTLDPPAPPPDRDGVDFFLFDSRTGYCDYFASAMAVMLRSVGIPARVVSGYAPGEIQSDGTFLIKDSDSHTWVEGYFPPYGWIPFEPSGGWPRLERGNGSSAASTPTPAAAIQPPPAQNQSQSQATPTPTPSPTPVAPGSQPTPPVTSQVVSDAQSLLPILAVLAALIGLVLLIWYLWERDLRGLPPSVVAYAKMTRLARLVGFGMRPTETPEEYGRALSAAAPETAPSTTRIVSDFARYRFGRAEPEPGDRPIRMWRFVRNALLRRIGRLSRRE